MAVVDANVVRVLARLRRLNGDQKSSGMVKLNAQMANALVDPVRPGCFNQVLLFSCCAVWQEVLHQCSRETCFEMRQDTHSLRQK